MGSVRVARRQLAACASAMSPRCRARRVVTTASPISRGRGRRLVLTSRWTRPAAKALEERRVRPQFNSTRYGTPAYGQLAAARRRDHARRRRRVRDGRVSRSVSAAAGGEPARAARRVHTGRHRAGSCSRTRSHMKGDFKGDLTRDTFDPEALQPRADAAGARAARCRLERADRILLHCAGEHATGSYPGRIGARPAGADAALQLAATPNGLLPDRCRPLLRRRRAVSRTINGDCQRLPDSAAANTLRLTAL